MSSASFASVGLQPVVTHGVNNWTYPLFPPRRVLRDELGKRTSSGKRSERRSGFVSPLRRSWVLRVLDHGGGPSYELYFAIQAAGALQYRGAAAPLIRFLQALNSDRRWKRSRDFDVFYSSVVTALANLVGKRGQVRSWPSLSSSSIFRALRPIFLSTPALAFIPTFLQKSN